MTTRRTSESRPEQPWPVFEPQPLLAEAFHLFCDSRPDARREMVDAVEESGRVPGISDDFPSEADRHMRMLIERPDRVRGIRVTAAYLRLHGIDLAVLNALVPRLKNSGVFVDLLLLGLQAGMSEDELRTAMDTRVWPDQDGLAALAMLRAGVTLTRSE